MTSLNPAIHVPILLLYRQTSYLAAVFSKFRPKAYQPQAEQDAAFLQKLKDDNEEKFMEHLFRTYYTPLCKAVYNITRDTDAAEDIVQDVFMKVWKKKDQLDLSQSVRAYLFRSSVNTALNYLEKNRRNTSMDHTEADSLRFSANTTENELGYREVSQRIDLVMEKLPPKCRTVFALSRYEELSYAQIAEQLGVSVKAVEKHMGKALKLMREHLQTFINHSA